MSSKSPIDPDNRICVCGHPESRHIVGHSIKRCNGFLPTSSEDLEIGKRSFCNCSTFKLHHTN